MNTKKLRKTIAIAAALALGLSASQCNFASVTPRDMTMEELKKMLQEEIDRYEEDRIKDEELIWDMGGYFSAGYGVNSCTESLAAAPADSAMAVSDSAAESADAYADSGAPTAYSSKVYLGPGPVISSATWNTEEYNTLTESGFKKVSTDPLSTFAADADTGSYCNLRRMIADGYSAEEIPSGAIRTEELLNYFDYNVKEKGEGKFSVQSETAACPWNEDHGLALMTIQANDTETPSAGRNFVFLLDTSGSMDEAEKIALAKCSFKLLAYTLTENDVISIVTYSGDSYVVLEGCPGSDYDAVCDALDQVYPYGGTNGSGGIEKAYEIAEKYFIEGGSNRVIVASDGDMNLGITSQSGLTDLIKEKKESGVFLTTLGYGSGNYSDANMEAIADAGNGNYFYIDCLDEAEHVLVNRLGQTTVTVAKDVKFQVEFNPANVAEYRLIGYENRALANDDFKNDKVDGGEIGAGAQVTILYEIVYNDGKNTESSLKYQDAGRLSDAADSDELFTLSVNYKEPAEDKSVTEDYVISPTEGQASPNMHLAVSLAELSMLLHSSDNAQNISWDNVYEEAVSGLVDGDTLREGYVNLVKLIR